MLFLPISRVCTLCVMPLRPVPLSINISEYPFHSHAEISPGTQRQQQSPQAPCLTVLADGQTPGPLSLSVPHCSIYTSIGGAFETPFPHSMGRAGVCHLPLRLPPASSCISCPLRVPRGVRTPLSFHRRICNPLPMPHRLRRPPPPQMSHPRRLVPSCLAAVATPPATPRSPTVIRSPRVPSDLGHPPKASGPARPPLPPPGRVAPHLPPPRPRAARPTPPARPLHVAMATASRAPPLPSAGGR